MSEPCIIGVDPGLDGAITIIRPSGIIEFIDTPVIGDKRKEYDSGAIFDKILTESLRYGPYNCRAAIENIHAMGMNGALANFSMGDARGTFRTVFSIAGIPLTWISPQKWKKDLGVQLKLGKDTARMRAIELFPHLSDKLNLKKHQGRADSLLIAECLRRSEAALERRSA